MSSIKINETQTEKETQFWLAHDRIKAKEPDKKVLFIKGCPYFTVKRDTLRILELVA